MFLPPSWGGAGLLPLADQADLAVASHVFRLLSCPDTVVKDTALSGLTVAARGKYGAAAEVTNTELAEYLNGSEEGQLGRTSGRAGSIWSAARVACKRLRQRLHGLSWSWNEINSCWQLTIPLPLGPVYVEEKSRGVLASQLRRSTLKVLNVTSTWCESETLRVPNIIGFYFSNPQSDY